MLFRPKDGPVIVCTRHDSLVAYLIEHGYIDPLTEVVKHAHLDQVRGKHVIGKCPLPMGVHALDVTEIPLDLCPSDRGTELTLSRLSEVAGSPQTFKILREK